MKYSYCFEKRSSKILLGTAYFGDTISQEESFKIMDQYLEMGGCHIDTARLYADGLAETVIGKWLRDRKPEGIFLSTKGGFYRPNQPSRLSEEELRYDLEQSLKELQVDCVDFYWLHRDDETIPVGQIVDTMNKFVKEGKIQNFGASNWRICRIDEANNYGKANGMKGFSASQIRFSPAVVAPDGNADRTLIDMDAESFSYYAEKKMPVAAYASQAKGFFSKMTTFGESGLSAKAKDRYLCQENLKRLEIIKRLSEKYECSVAATVCSALCSIDMPDVFPIIGGSSVEQIADSMTGADIGLENDEIKELFGF